MDLEAKEYQGVGARHCYWHPEMAKELNEEKYDLIKVAITPLKMCKVYNLFGGPGSGKSTTAAGVFHELKCMGINCELITEYPKELVWAKSFKTLEDQIHILGEQSHRQFRVRDQVDLIITDAPILFSLYYGRNLSSAFKSLVREIFNEYDNINYLVERGRKYNPAGRTQDEEGANKVHKEILQMLEQEDVPFKTIVAKSKEIGQRSMSEAVKIIVDDVLKDRK